MHWETTRRLGAEWDRVGPGHALGFNEITLRLGPNYKDRPSRAAHALGFNEITLRLGPGYKDRPSRAAWGRFGPSGAE